MDLAKINAAITKRSKAIMPVHLHGRVADMDPILALARRYGLIVIEDAAQAHGAEYRGRRAGTFGDIGCFSFYASKNWVLPAKGAPQYQTIQNFSSACACCGTGALNTKVSTSYEATITGWRICKGDFTRQASVLGRVDPAQTSPGLATYDSRFDAMGVLRPPCTAQHDRHGCHIYAIRVPERDAVRRQMIDADISVGVHYLVPVDLQPAFADLGIAAVIYL